MVDQLTFEKPFHQSRLLIAGATGFIGKRLLLHLDRMGCAARCLVRPPEKLDLPVQLANKPEIVHGDLLKPESLSPAVEGIDTAFYLVHSMGGRSIRETREFETRDRHAAENFIRAAQSAGVSRIIYLGGLGEMADDLSSHLASRQEVGHILQSATPKTTVLRAAVIIGAGGAGFEIIRYLTERLPVMLCPRWIYTRSQPIAIQNVLDYLAGCAQVPETAGGSFDIGGPDILSYADLIGLYARVRGIRRTIIPVPMFSPRISAYWITLITPVPAGVVLPLAEGLKNEAICRNDRIRELVPVDLISMEQAICTALSEETSGPGILSRQSCFLSPRESEK